MSFRREAHVPRGGPDGGDGGRGGAVVAVCDASLRDLQALARRTHYGAPRGAHGSGSLRHGASGEDLELAVPPGTEIVAADEPGAGGRRWELLGAGQRAVLARGGAGGRGNKRFASATRQTPRFAERGLAGEEGWLELRLRLLADVGLVGMPNAGKSSLLGRLTRAAPKVGDYPFTTLSPVLGVLEGDERQLVIADIPGLIAGASEGAGLGDEFLAHVERTSVLVHVLDVAPELSAGEGADPLANYEVVERELAAHDERLARLPRVLVLSKADLRSAQRLQHALDGWRRRLGADVPVLAVSSATGAGLAQLRGELLARVPAAAPALAGDGVAAVARADDHELERLPEHVLLRPGARDGFRVERIAPRVYAVRGFGIERLVSRFDTENEDALAYLRERLRRIGVMRALADEGFQPGDRVDIGAVSLALGQDRSR